nr:hypothetical protein [Rudaea cellulosilytica]
MKDLNRIRPDFSLRFCIGKWNLAWVGFPPPSLSLGVRSDLDHITLEVVADVFEIREQEELSLNFLQCNGVVANVAIFDPLKDARPSFGVKLDVVVRLLRPVTECTRRGTVASDTPARALLGSN